MSGKAMETFAVVDEPEPERSVTLLKVGTTLGLLLLLVEIPWLVASWRAGYLLYLRPPNDPRALRHLVGVTVMWPVTFGVLATIRLGLRKF